MSLLICTPMYGGLCQAAHFQSCLQLKEDLTLAGFKHDWLITTNESLITRARDVSAATYLTTDYERLLFIDGDIDFNTEDVEKLWNMDVDVAVAAYAMKRPDSPLSAWKGGKMVEIGGRASNFEVDYAGTGFMMIKRHVFEKLQKYNPSWEYREGKVGECWAFFQDPISKGEPEDRFHLSEDYFFCEQWRKLGGKVILNPTIKLGHWGLYRYG